MINKQTPLVSIHCLAYNHKDYIAQAIESFLMQKTNFQFEIIIGEDYSTDGTREIVFDYEKKYPDLIRVITSDKNVGMNENALRTKIAARGKYISFCEGDDYWIDPLKLQKQVDFLEENPDYGMVHTDLHEYNTVKKTWRKNIWKNKKLFQEGDLFNSLIIGRTTGIYTCTTTVRKDILLDFDDNLSRMNLAMGDSVLRLTVASKSKIGYIDQATAVRQLLEYSATQGIGFEGWIHFLDSISKLLDYFSQKVNIDPEILALAKKSIALRYLEHYSKYGKKKEFKESYTAFRSKYFEPEAELIKTASWGKYPGYFSRFIFELLVKYNLDFQSKVYKKLKKQEFVTIDLPEKEEISFFGSIRKLSERPVFPEKSILTKEIFGKLVNGFFYFGSSIVGLLFSLFTFPIYSSYLSAEDYGLIGYFTSLRGFIVPMFNLSLSNYFMMRYFKQNKEENEKSLFNILFYLSINNVIVSIVFFIIGYQYFKLSDVSYPFYPFFILMMGMAFFDPYKLFLLQQYRIRKQGLFFFLFSVMAPILNASFSLLLIVVFDLGVIGRMVGMTLSVVVLGATSLFFLKRFTRPDFSFQEFKRKVLSILPLAIAAYAYIPIETFDRIFLEKLKMPEKLGLYSIGLQITGFFLMAAIALFKAFEPNIFQAIINNNKKRLNKEIFQYYTILIIGFIVFFLLLNPIINLLTRGKFADAVYYAQYLSFARLLSAISILFSAIILAKQKANLSAVLVFIVSFFSIVLYPFFTSKYAFEGALFVRILIPLIGIIVSLIILKWNAGKENRISSV
jgi:O-antigen/teichoic acid export membrane protein